MSPDRAPKGLAQKSHSKKEAKLKVHLESLLMEIHDRQVSAKHSPMPRGSP